jgi:hypothetical protein
MLSAVVSAAFAASAGPAGSAVATAFSAASVDANAVSAAGSDRDGHQTSTSDSARRSPCSGHFSFPRSAGPVFKAVANKKPASGNKPINRDRTHRDDG